jgi:hypothetical protein
VETKLEPQAVSLGTTGVGAPSHKVLQLHKNLHKAESSMLTQIQTGRIGLAAFLNKMRVPDYPSPMCRCGQLAETATHIIAHCRLYEDDCSSLRESRSGWVNMKSLVGTPERAEQLARWFIKLHILPQFNLAEELLIRQGMLREQQERDNHHCCPGTIFTL